MFAITQSLKFIGGILVVALIAGCAAAPTASPTPIPTIDTQPTFNAISTHAVETVIAGLTQNAPTVTPVPPTDTPQPTSTLGPTNTLEPTATETRVFIPWTKTPTATLPPYGCVVTNVTPKSSDTIKVDQDFDGSWTLTNTGSETWSSGNVDARFVDGTKFHTGGDMVDLSSNVAPNGTYTLTIDMKAPSGDGSYSTTWALRMSEGYICEFVMNIKVSK